jgi:hypothetical protein
MTNKFTALIAASLLSLSATQAKARAGADPAKDNLVDVENHAHLIAVEADTLWMISRDSHPLSTATLGDLETVRERINHVGKELRALDGQRSALLPWEQRTLDQVIPLFADAARAETQAIEYCNENRMHPVGPEFRAYVERLKADADRAAKLISEHVRLENAKNTESKMDQLLHEAGN